MRFKIDLSESEQRLDKWIKRKFNKLPQNLLEKLARKGKIKLNKKKIKLSYKLKVGDVIETPNFIIKKKNVVKKKNGKLNSLKNIIKKNILHKDKEKIINNKPAGIAVHKGTKTSLSIDDLKDDLKFSFEENPRIIHRIDKETSGLLVIARTYKSSVYLSKQFKERKVKKTYFAILNGVPKKTKGLINEKIDNSKNKDAVTKYEVLKKIGNKLSIVLLYPLTGRKRQIREHCFQLGCPVIGDKKFYKQNNKKFLFDSKNLLLHAYKLEFIKENLSKEEFKAPIPEYIKKFCISYKIILKNIL